MIILVYFDDCILILKEYLLFRSLLISWKIPLRVLSSRRKWQWMRISVLTFLHCQTGKDLHCLDHYWWIELSNICVLIQRPKSCYKQYFSCISTSEKYENGPARKASWKYCGIIGMLGFLQGTTRPDIAMAIHQCAIFKNDPHLSHERLF